MAAKIAQKIHLTSSEKKLLEQLSKEAAMSLSDFVGKLIMEAAGRKPKEANLGKIEATLDNLASFCNTFERIYQNSIFNRVVLTNAVLNNAPNSSQERVMELWNEHKTKNGWD